MKDQIEREDRERAILVMASRVQNLSVDDLEALCELAIDSEGATLAEMVLNPALCAGSVR